MENFNGTLCITHAELTNGIVSKSLIDKWQSCGKIERVRRGCNNTPALFAVESLPVKYKREVYHRFPDYQAQADSRPFVETIRPDAAACSFFETYTLADGRYLSTSKQREYANNAAILNAFKTVLERANSQRKRQSKRGISKVDFWKKAAQALPRLADRFPHSLPENPRRLQEKFNRYGQGGYAMLIPAKYGLRNAAKVDDDTKESILAQLLADARNLSNAQIAPLYNLLATAQGWKTITPSAVEVWRGKLDLVTAGGRLGATRFRNQRTMQVKRSRPTLPLLYWTMDGWTAELLYQKSELRAGRTVTTYTNRLTLVLVLDPCLNYPVGYAIGERENPALIRAALRSAANHTAELFGRRYRVNQLQTDNYGRGSLTPTYRVMGDKYTPARAHNAKSKVIEPFFNYFNRKYCQLCKNWSGFGITSNRNLQPNSEFLNKQRHSFPSAEQCAAQLTAFVERERAEKRGQYVELFAGLPEERRLPLSDEQYLLAFGAQTGFTNAIEGAGLCPTIEGVRRNYDSFDPQFRRYAHVSWSVHYDPGDLNRVLAVNEDGTLRFMLESKYVQPMALAERKPGDALQLERVAAYNKQLETGVADYLAVTHAKVDQFFNDNPQLDVATRLLLCDSRGQNKNHKQTRRLQAREVEEIPAEEIRPVEYPAPRADEHETIDLY